MFKFVNFLKFLFLSFVLVGFISMFFAGDVDFDKKYYIIELNELDLNLSQKIVDSNISILEMLDKNSILVELNNNEFYELLNQGINDIYLYKNGNSISDEKINRFDLFNFDFNRYVEKNFVLEVIDEKYLFDIILKIEDLGGSSIEFNNNSKIVSFRILEDKVFEIGEFLEVLYVDEILPVEIQNNVGKRILGVNDYFDNLNLFGLGQIIAVADSGLDTGNLSNIHQDFRNKNVTISEMDFSGVDEDGPGDKFSGHGTHVAGSVLGTGVLSGANLSNNSFIGSNSGSAPLASLYFQALEVEFGGQGSLLVPNDLQTYLFQPAYDFGSRIHTNSWGSDSNHGNYSSASRQINQFVWNNNDFLLLFAAGNYGSSGNTTITPQASSKNILAVGAVDSSKNIAWFSSKGNTLDGRIKPDVTSYGVGVISANSKLINQNDYRSMSGTSMATPLAAGISGLVREYLIKNKSISNPRSSLIKSIIINGAEDKGIIGPDNLYGFGVINLTNSILENQTREIIFYEHTTGIILNSNFDYNLNINESVKSIKTTLVWNDYPANVGSDTNLVNDLDFILIAGNGTQYLGNDFMMNNSFDRKNNVEQIILNRSHLVDGNYTLRVRGQNVVFGPQPFSFVVLIDKRIEFVFNHTLNLKITNRTYNDSLNYNFNISFNQDVSYLEYYIEDNLYQNLSNQIINNSFIGSLNLTNNSPAFIKFRFGNEFYNREIRYNLTYVSDFVFNHTLDLKMTNRTSEDSLNYNFNISFNQNVTYLEYHIENNFSLNLTNQIINKSFIGSLNLTNNSPSFIKFRFGNDFYNREIRYNLTYYINDSLENYLVGNVSDDINFTFYNYTLNFRKNNSLIEFNWTINKTINLSNIKIEINKSNNLSKLFVFGINLTDNLTKSISFELINSSKNNGVCLRDEIVSDFNFSLNCNESNEYYINSFPYVGKYNVTKLNNSVTVYGLSHSAVYQMCSENWSYSSWSSCSSSGQQSRSATDLNNCGTNLSRLNLVQSCTYTPPVTEPTSPSTDGGGGGGSSGGDEPIKTSQQIEISNNPSISSDLNQNEFHKIIISENSDLDVFVNFKDIKEKNNFNKISQVDISINKTKIITFDYDFSKNNLDLENINFVFGNYSNNFSFVGIDGISNDVENSKIYLSNSLDLGFVCIKKSIEFEYIKEYNGFCDDSDEFRLTCDNTKYLNYSCNTINGAYVVEGIKNGLILEVSNFIKNDDFTGNVILENDMNLNDKTNKFDIWKYKIQFYLALALIVFAVCFYFAKLGYFNSIFGNNKIKSDKPFNHGVSEYIKTCLKIGVSKSKLMDELKDYYDKKELKGIKEKVDRIYSENNLDTDFKKLKDENLSYKNKVFKK